MGSRFVAHCSPTSMPVNCAPREGCALRHRGVAQSGSAPALGAGCRGFESLHPDQLLPVTPQRRGLAFGSVRQTLCMRFLMVAVAHQVEHRIVAPEVAGSRPVSHPISPLTKAQTEAAEARPCLGALLGREKSSATKSFSEGRKKEGAIHAPVRCVSGLGLMAFHGHLKHPCRPDVSL